ncbi:MAG: ammonium transporter, partial [Dehalococcoidia bacterium]
GVDGLFFGNAEQFLRQLASVAVALAYSFIVSYAIAFALDRTMGIRVSEEEERQGLDLALHDEQSWVFTE